MAETHKPHLYRRQLGWAVLLFAVALLAVQSWLFGHELEHLTGDSDKVTCEICLVGGGLAHAHATSNPPLLSPPLSGEAPEALPATGGKACPAFSFQGRAPPVVS